MIKFNLQIFGGRGASSGGAGGGAGAGTSSTGSSEKNTFSSADELEKSLTGANDPRYKEYEEAYKALADGELAQEIKDTESVLKNNNLSINDWTKDVFEKEKEKLQNRLDNMPKEKTAAQFGEEEGAKYLIEEIDKLLSIKSNGKSAADSVSILA